jgi:hypothetical protein
MSLEGYYEMYGKKYKTPYLINRILNNQPANIINRFTGLEIGYGYFAPNVRANFFVDIIIDSNIYKPNLKSFEGNIRYTNMLSEIFSNSYNTDSTNKVIILKKKLDNLKLINIVEYTLLSNHIENAKNIMIECYCLDNNSLDDFRNNLPLKKLLVKTIKFN